MGMSLLVLQVLASYALWLVISQSSLPVWSRLRDKLVERWSVVGTFLLCPLCSGFWCSLAVAPFSTRLSSPSVADFGHLLVMALAGAAGIYLIETYVSRLEAR
jgi:hypothetical protein